jgi:hypothetical protein
MTGDVRAPDVDAAVGRRVGGEADRARLVALDRAVQQDPEDDARGERDEEPDVQPCSSGSPQKTGSRARARCRWTPAATGRCRSAAARRAEQVDADPQRDVVEHDRRDHLAHGTLYIARAYALARTTLTIKAWDRAEHFFGTSKSEYFYRRASAELQIDGC